MTTYELRPSDISGAIRPLLPLTAEFKLCCKAEENMESGNAQSLKAEWGNGVHERNYKGSFEWACIMEFKLKGYEYARVKMSNNITLSHREAITGGLCCGGGGGDYFALF